MMDEGYFWVKAVALVTTAIVVIVIVCCIDSAYEARVFASQGYTQASLPGHTGTYWVKPNECKP